jgi:mRNA interferase RelE/StbE
MESWHLVLVSKAQRELDNIDPSIRKDIILRLQWFTDHFNNTQSDPLHGEWKGFFKFRISDWRVVYNYHNSKRLITVHQIDRRDKVYKRK